MALTGNPWSKVDGDTCTDEEFNCFDTSECFNFPSCGTGDNSTDLLNRLLMSKGFEDAEPDGESAIEELEENLRWADCWCEKLS
jgi:hypothetical protein